MTAGTLESSTRELALVLGRLERHTWATVQHLSQTISPGEFRPPYRFPYGLERDVPRTFTMDDDPATLSTTTVPPSLVTRSLAEAILRGDMRATQAVHHGDAVFAVVADVSRSVLAGCFAGGPAALDAGATTKVQALYLSVATYLKLAESTGFSLRAIYAGNGRATELRATAPRTFVQQVLFGLSQRLLAAFTQATVDPHARELPALSQALALTNTYRHRGIVVLASDFLDEFASYSSALGQVAARHRVVLLDLAAPADRAFPVPGWLDVEATRVPVREGARHLEEGTAPRLLDRRGVERWNRERTSDHRALTGLATRYTAELAPAFGRSYQEITTRAMASLSLAPRR